MSDGMCERYDRHNGEWEWLVKNFTCPRVGCGWHDPDGELARANEALRAREETS